MQKDIKNAKKEKCLIITTKSLPFGRRILVRLKIHHDMVSQYDSRKFFLMFLIVIIALAIDISFSNIADIISKQAVSFAGVTLFVIIATVYIVGGYFILQLVKKKNKESNIRSLHINTLEKIVAILQYLLSAIMVFLVLQIIISSHYYTDLLTAATAISYGLAAVLMGLLAQRLFSWFRLSKNFAVLLYALAAATITVNSIASIFLFDEVLISKPSEVTPQSEVVFQVGFAPGTIMSVVATLQSPISAVGYFLLTWGGTIMLLRHNIQRVGKVKFWILITAPLVYFLSYYFTLYQTLNPSTPTPAGSALTLSILVFTYAVTLCGILFGVGFRSVSRSILQNSHVRDYMIITAYGFILFFSAGNATVLQAGYPPFGLANVSFVGLSSFLILVGLYSSAISIANDTALRLSAKKSINAKLLDSIGTAQMQEEIENEVVKITKANAHVIAEQSGIEPSLTDDEVKKYMDSVIEEIKNRKK